ncbi:SAP domain-containing protein [Aspergillus saccharolyticus JOP 1030-1]|uniref:SAP domain-containing protein n=1 Tax=Aspergillus saccharolyticus JOP 1030-1 TaxID=1450539 RepID=A0A318ZQ72_9EURO|nr:hypothetical protein BP01DRAFT_352718 [Aspergillus saccharolyticus JOP 1030-1]PYH49187.1 hypothetical protein BP01DRAFT_352718 [Aspergillus saccharolyticus JOP 1030-1]
MSTDYSKKTNAELVEILKSRSLPHNGKKAEMVARLQEDDNKAADNAKTTTEGAAPAAADDVIDWEDDEVPATEAAAKSSTEAGAAAIAAGGKGEVANPVAVPNQKLDTDPATTNDLKVESVGAAASAQEKPEAATDAAATATTTEEAEQKPAPSFAAGLPVTEMEEELKKRKARAEKFGITEESKAAIEAAEKQLERAKRFGTAAIAAPTTEVGVKRLDEALPEEKPRKRGRGDNEQGGSQGGKRRDFGGRNKSRRQGRGNRNQGQGQTQRQQQNGSGNKSSGWSEKDAQAMEARKKRFG